MLNGVALSLCDGVAQESLLSAYKINIHNEIKIEFFCEKREHNIIPYIHGPTIGLLLLLNFSVSDCNVFLIRSFYSGRIPGN